MAALKAYYQSRSRPPDDSLSPDSLASRESSEARETSPGTHLETINKLQQEKQVRSAHFGLEIPRLSNVLVVLLDPTEDTGMVAVSFEFFVDTVVILWGHSEMTCRLWQELEEARDALMQQVSSSSRHREALQEQLSAAIGETEQLSEVNAELAEQLSPPPYRTQLSFDPLELDEGEWRVRCVSHGVVVLLDSFETWPASVFGQNNPNDTDDGNFVFVTG